MKLFLKLIIKTYLYYSIILFVLIIASCTSHETKKEPKPFSLIDNTVSGLNFTNKVTENLYFNFLNYSYIYNGAGIAVGDINNDGLEDLYFSSNQESNKLFLNKGNFKFEDITAKAHVEDQNGWSTGVSMIDINNDGWLDIYVCKSGSLESHELRKNKLYINQQNNTFIESAAAYGLDHFGFSVQAYFFDYDNDNDLDMYLVNHRQDFQNNTTINPLLQQQKEPYNSDQLFRNDSNHFTNVTIEAGIENKAWGLSASIGDFNNDGLLDVFVSNDFLEPDFLYINQGDGTFKDEILQRFKHISANSMGSDYGDINNDLNPDLIVLDMLAEDHIRSKENMASMSTDNFNLLVKNGYHHQYMSNILQLNNGDGSFSEIGQLAGIAKTDWSWAPLIADFDNDGFNDLFVANGIEHDLSNQDFRNQMKTNIRNRKKVSLNEAIKMMPSNKLSNYIFKNNKDLTFTNATQDWGFDAKVNSSGAVYTDLDNDGNLDIVVNNQSEMAQIYRNNTSNNSVSFSLVGPVNNLNGIGTKINIYTEGLQQSKTLFTSRGYQSSVTDKLHFGLGNRSKIDSVQITWQDGSLQSLYKLTSGKSIVVNYKNAKKQKQIKKQVTSFFESINPEKIGITYVQKENDFNDFKLQLLLPQKQSELSKPLAVADVNNDGLEDFFVGNAKGASGSLYIQKSDGAFIETNKTLFNSEKNYEDTNAKFLDVDNDNDLDLYVASGGYEFDENDPLLQDRLYINDSKGNFTKSNKLPKIYYNSKAIAIADYDGDGDIDIFIGCSVKHGKYPLSYPSYLLENQGGKFVEVTSKVINDISELKMVNDAIFSDYDNDGDMDIITVGEWMPVTLFENNNHNFIKKDFDALKNSDGWYQSITEFDKNNDGIKDYVLGNWGDNNKFHPSPEKPLHIYADYFDDNNSFDIVLSKESKTGELLPVRGKECSSQQTPYLNGKIKTYEAFATSTLPEIYGKEKLDKALHYKVKNFSSNILNNKGHLNFEIVNLPEHAQFAPTLRSIVFDMNNDGFLDVFGVGNVYESEVETIRYDASKGYVLLGNKDGNFTFLNDISYFNNGEAKAIEKIMIHNAVHFIILNKNNTLKILRLNP